MRNFKNMLVYDKSKKLAVSIYKITEQYPKSEIFGLTSQLRRAAVSIGSNLAEGCSRSSDKDFLRFVEVALGSARECEYQLEISRELNYISESKYEEVSDIIDHVCRMLVNLSVNLKNRL